MGKKDLLIVTHVQHYIWDDQIWAFGGYAREVDIWADIFPSIIIASPCIELSPPGDCLPLTRKNISVIPVQTRENSGILKCKFLLFFYLPRIIWKLSKLMREAWAVHVRLPGNLGAIGALLAPLFSERIIAKYAGTWPNFEGEPKTYRLQKSLLKSRWFSGPVTVYGDWPNQPDHVIPFFTSILTTDQIELAKKASEKKHLHFPSRILFVGRMDRGKNAHILLDALQILKKYNYSFEARIIGDGNQKEELHQQVLDLGLQSRVTFTGAIPFSSVLENYIWGDILVLTSENSEGWPKAIAEAMAFGLVCFGSERGLIPKMLSEKRGVVVDPVTANNLADCLKELLNSPSTYKTISKNATEWSQNYSLNGLRKAIKELLIHSWNLKTEEGTLFER